jgi:hypothetical protein
MDFESFQHSHGAQLANVPRIYWRALYEKLVNEVSGHKGQILPSNAILTQEYDAGKHFCMNRGDEGWSVVVSSAEGLAADDPSG